VVPYVTSALDVDREPRAVNWVFSQGYKRAHAFALYFVVRNLLKPAEGRVSAVEDINFGFKCAVLLLLRSFQDVKACRKDMAKDNVDHVYTYIRDKIWLWVRNHDNKPTTPAIAKIHAEVGAWLRESGRGGREYPLPTWCTSFRAARLGWTFFWETPAAYDIEAFRRSKGIPATREEVTVAFMQALADAKTWKDVFSIRL
jgi:hypothetical protein